MENDTRRVCKLRATIVVTISLAVQSRKTQYHESHRSTGGHTFDCRMERVLGAEVFVVVHSEE